MYRVCFIFCLTFLTFQVQGQDREIDSLNSVLKTELPDSARVFTLLELSSKFYRSDPSESRRLGMEARTLAEQIGFQRGLGYAYKSIGMGYYFENNWVDALVQWRLALKAFEAAGDLSGVSNMLNNLGAVHFNGGDDEPALDYYLQSLRVAEQTGDSLRIVTALINIGSVYLTKKTHHDLAFKYYQRALPLSIKLGDNDAIGTCAVNLGEIFLIDNQKPDSALYYFEKALDAYQKTATGNVAFALKNIGRVYAAREEYEKALQYQRDAFNLAKSLGGRLEMAQSLLSLAGTYELMGDYKNAISSYNQARELSSEIGASYEVQEAYRGLAINYAEISDFRNAYINHTLFASAKDTLYNAEMDKKLQAQTLSYEIENKQGRISLLEKEQEVKELEIQRQKIIRNASAISGILLLVLVGGLINRNRYMKRSSKIIAEERDRSDRLLLNILPVETAEELKEKGSATPKYYDMVSVLFTDFKGFTLIAEKLSPQELVQELNECFIAFDEIMDKYNLEKIKTIGDAYMCAGGVPTVLATNPADTVSAALEIREFMSTLKKKREAEGKAYWELRIGIHTGPVIAGVVGKNKFAYDIWGDAVNIASRMESSGIPGEVNISGATYHHVKHLFECTYRGKVEAKNKGEIDMYIVEGPLQNA